MTLFGTEHLPDEDDTKLWWRCWLDVKLRSYHVDEWGDAKSYELSNPNVTLHWEWFHVLKITPKGVHLGPSNMDYMSKPRFVLRDARKRYAAPTRAEAFESLKARNAKRRRLLRYQLNASEVGYDWLRSEAAGVPQ